MWTICCPSNRLDLDSMMVTPESIQLNIAQGMATEHLSVVGDGQHFEAVVVSEAFTGKSRVQRHQLVYQTLGDRMREEIHALSMKTYTPQ
jgi:acid stress-induced BolA-like protein IbaG/YrbA